MSSEKIVKVFKYCHSFESFNELWWLILTVNLMEFKVTMETNLYAFCQGFFLIIFFIF